MKNSRKYASMTPADKQRLHRFAWVQWKAALKRLLISFSLPLICVLGVWLFLLYVTEGGDGEGGSLIPTKWSDLIFLWLLTPIYLIIAFGNIVMFFRSIPPIYVDVLRGKKRLIEFKPEPYTIAESDKYYVATKLPILPFLEVSHEHYLSIDYDTNCHLEISPFSKIPLGFRTIQGVELPAAEACI